MPIAGPRKQSHDPAVVAGEDGRDQRRRNPAVQAEGLLLDRYRASARHSTSQTTIQIISQTKSGSVMAVVCR